MAAETVASVLAGGASIIVSAAAVGTYRQARRFINLTEANRRDLRGAEEDDRGLVHYVREHRAVLRELELLPASGDFYRGDGGAVEDEKNCDPKNSADLTSDEVGA